MSTKLDSVHINILNEWATVAYLIQHGKGIARFGDGEFKLANDRDMKLQWKNKDLGERLRQILKDPWSVKGQCIVGLPRIYQDNPAPPNTKEFSFWENMRKNPISYNHINTDCIYGSSFISRPDNVDGLNCQGYFDSCKQMWEGRSVVIVRGEGVPFCQEPEFLDNCKIVGELICPKLNAWENYDNILKQCINFHKDTLFLIRLGPTATVLAWDLGLHGRQALDLGHLGMFYSRFKRNDNSLWDYEDKCNY